jgi:hypothetical protein
MAKHKKSVAGDNALREFYQSCGLSPATIKGTIKARYEVSTTISDRDEALANVMSTNFREQIVAAGARREASRRKRARVVRTG